MKETLHQIKTYLRSIHLKKYVKGFIFLILGLIGLLLITCGGLSFYFNQHKTEIIAQINARINDKINGKFHVGDFHYKFLTGFPNFTLALKDVELKDNQWQAHRHTLLKAQEIEVRLNIWSLLQQEINIQKILLNEADIYLYKAKDGYSNTAVFKPTSTKTSKSKTETTLNEIDLNQVHFTINNRLGNKLFDFDISSLKSKVNYNQDNWETNIFLRTNIKSLAFNTVHGSFAKEKELKGTFNVSYSSEKQKIDVVTQNLKIGRDTFDIMALFKTNQDNALFGIHIETKILWRSASDLLSQNISSKLNQFNLNKPIQVSCDINGDFNAEGDPKIVVQAEIKNNQLTIPDGLITDCTFKGIFTNNFKPKNGFNDANSAIILTHFTGKYQDIPLKIPQATINNLEKPIATGYVNSDFDVTKLNELNNDRWIHFEGGHATARLNFQFDIVDLYITKPLFTGNINVSNTSFHYIPNNVHAEKINIQLDFTQQALLIKKIGYKHKKNTIFIEGKIDNFLNLYYDAPEKMLVNWTIFSPYIDVKQLLGVLTASQKKKTTTKTHTKPTISNQLRTAIDKCAVVINLKADRIVYNKLTATNATASIQMLNSKLLIKNGSLQTSGGNIRFDSQVQPSGKNYTFSSNAQVNQVEIASFLKSFNNFGIQSFSPSNIKGKLNSRANVNGLINSTGELITNSIHGNLTFNVNQGALLNFDPIVKIGKFAFPFRDVKNITFSDLSANLKIRGQEVDLNHLTISSSVLNLDAEGVYSFGRGTNIALSIPLRNSKNDAKLASQAERDAVRDRGIVLHLNAVDDQGKIKIKWGKKNK